MKEKILLMVLSLIISLHLLGQDSTLHYTKIDDKKFNWKTGTREQFDSIYLALPNPNNSTIPTDTLIKSWKTNFFDCFCGIDFDFKIDGKYTSQAYPCLCGQDSLDAAVKLITSAKNLVFATFNLKDNYDKFTSLLPSGVYSSNSFMFLYKTKFTKKGEGNG